MSAESGPDGGFDLVLAAENVLPAAGRNVRCEVRAQGFVPEEREVLLRPGETALLGDLMLEFASRVSGVVLDDSGTPVAGISVGVLDPVLDWKAWELRAGSTLDELALAVPRAGTGSDGTFALEGVPPGRLRIVAAAEGWLPAASEEIEVRAGAVTTGMTVTIARRTVPDAIRGVVETPAGTRVPGARVRLRGGGQSRSSRADEEGRFSFGSLSEAPYDLSAVDPHWGEARKEGVRPGADLIALAFTEPQRFQLRVLDDSGRPLERFAAALTDATDGTRRTAAPLDQHPGGAVEVLLPAADFLIEVESPHWMPLSEGPFSPETFPETWECRMQPARGIAGRVLSQGKPVRGASVTLHEAFRGLVEVNGVAARSSPIAYASDTTGAEGEFLMGVPDAGRYYLRVEFLDRAPAERGPLQLGPSAIRREEVEVTPGGSIEAVVRSAVATDVVGRIVRISRGDGFARTARTGADGIARFGHLTPGPWWVALTEREATPGETVILSQEGPAEPPSPNATVEEGVTTEIVLWLGDPAPHALVGNLSVDGQGADGWQARLESPSAAPVATRLERDGSFRLGASKEGPYRLVLTRAAASGLPPTVILDDVILDGPQTEWSFDFETATLRAGPSPSLGAAGLLVHEHVRGSVRCLTPLVPGSDGHLLVHGLPAGPGRIFRADGDRPMAEQAVEVLLEVDLEAGATTSVEWESP